MSQGKCAYYSVRSVFAKQAVWRPGKISQTLGLSRKTVHKHLNNLIEQDLITKYAVGKKVLYCRLILVPIPSKQPTSWRPAREWDYA